VTQQGPKIQITPCSGRDSKPRTHDTIIGESCSGDQRQASENEGIRLYLGPPFWKRTKRWHPIKLKPQKGSKQRAVGVLKARTKKDGRSLSLHGFPWFVLAHNLFGPRVAAGLLVTRQFRPMTVKGEENQFFSPATLERPQSRPQRKVCDEPMLLFRSPLIRTAAPR